MLPDITVMGKVIGGGLPAAAYGASVEPDEPDRARPATSTRPARCAGTRSPSRPGAATLELLDEDAYVHLAATTEALASGLRRGRRRPAGAGRVRRPGLLTVFFSERAGARLRGRRRVRHRRVRRLVPRAARARRLPAAVAVRGLVPLARPHARARRRARSRSRRPRSRRSPDERARPARRRAAHRRRADRPAPSPTRGRTTARSAPRPPPARAPPAARRTTRCSSRRSSRATCSTTAPGGWCGPTIPTSRCSPATGSTRSASPGSPSWATSTAVSELADVISLAAQAHAEGDAERADASGPPAPRPSATAAGPSWRPPRPPRGPATRAPRARCAPRRHAR